MPFFPRVGEMRHAGLKTEEERVLAEVAGSVTKTARPPAHSWDGKSNIGAGFVAKRNRSDCARRILKGPVDAKTLTEKDPNALGWLVQAHNPNLYTYGEARVLFINGVYIHTIASVPVGEALKTRSPEFLPLDVLRQVTLLFCF